MSETGKNAVTSHYLFDDGGIEEEPAQDNEGQPLNTKYCLASCGKSEQ